MALQTFPFLQLPGEIRNRIYYWIWFSRRYKVESSEDCEDLSIQCSGIRNYIVRDLRFLFTSKQIYHEMCPIIGANCVLRIGGDRSSYHHRDLPWGPGVCPGCWSTILDWERRFGGFGPRFIVDLTKSLSSQWPSTEFLQQQLIPILNRSPTKLRELEIRVTLYPSMRHDLYRPSLGKTIQRIATLLDVKAERIDIQIEHSSIGMPRDREKEDEYKRIWREIIGRANVTLRFAGLDLYLLAGTNKRSGEDLGSILFN
jgi:hypothetical protein